MSQPTSWLPGFDPQSAPVFTHNELRTTLDAQTLWPVLVRVKDWPSWYPHAANIRTPGAEPDLRLGSVFRWKTMGVNLRTEVVEFEPFTALAWIATGPVSRAFHRWDFAPAAEGGCLVSTEEVETGIAPRLLARRLKRDLSRAHQVWLEQLVERAS